MKAPQKKDGIEQVRKIIFGDNFKQVDSKLSTLELELLARIELLDRKIKEANTLIQGLQKEKKKLKKSKVSRKKMSQMFNSLSEAV